MMRWSVDSIGIPVHARANGLGRFQRIATSDPGHGGNRDNRTGDVRDNVHVQIPGAQPASLREAEIAEPTA